MYAPKPSIPPTAVAALGRCLARECDIVRCYRYVLPCVADPPRAVSGAGANHRTRIRRLREHGAQDGTHAPRWRTPMHAVLGLACRLHLLDPMGLLESAERRLLAAYDAEHDLPDAVRDELLADQNAVRRSVHRATTRTALRAIFKSKGDGDRTRPQRDAR